MLVARPPRVAVPFRRLSGHTDVYGRMFRDRPAPALSGRCCGVSDGRFGHPEQDHAISLREAAARQSVPDQYRFFDTNTDFAEQVGNAVPVRLAECLAGRSCACNERRPARPLEPLRLGRS